MWCPSVAVPVVVVVVSWKSHDEYCRMYEEEGGVTNSERCCCISEGMRLGQVQVGGDQRKVDDAPCTVYSSQLPVVLSLIGAVTVDEPCLPLVSS